MKSGMNFEYFIVFVCRFVSYIVNGFYKYYVIVVVEVVVVLLEFFIEELVFYFFYGMFAEVGENVLLIFVKFM